MLNKTVLLTILDGWGCGKNCSGNAIASANLPTYKALLERYPHTKIYADGEHVGLPEGQMGNSEVGHLNLGAGRTVYQELTRINKSIREGDFFENTQFLKAIDHVKKNNSSIHFMGLVSPGGVHSSMDHLFALIDLAKKHGLTNVYVHAFLDGRDTPPQSAIEYVNQVDAKLKNVNLSSVASVIGRYYAMDRDNRWDRVEKAYNCLLFGEGNKAVSAEEGIRNSYNNDLNDEFVLPTMIGDTNSRLKDNDAIIFFNFRPDRARELTRVINDLNFDGFVRKNVLQNTYYICMTKYDETFNLPIAFLPQSLKGILGEVLDNNNIQQFRTAETEKYAHITFFFNGGMEKAFPTETRALVQSPKVATYDLKPEMSAPEVADNVVKALKSKKYGFILVNFANPDMVGHTGIFEAAVKAVETVDTCLNQIVDAVKEVDAVMLLTADHGNAECMEDLTTHKPFTAHTNNEVPFVMINYGKEAKLREEGTLADVAPTVLDLLDIQKPEEMTGVSLIEN
ncbi:MAG: 2,3-bisphosphoglycerate-independent phosphoglycerate mutase [Candidatus Gastranaerophilales bacterium]|nr:2,3-bisphosphoglycerate-independent phosphoglycerate mutase [Candidatus Gastranaerophilales bacterium]